MKNKAVIFPYNSECAAVINNRHMLKKHDIVACLSPCGYGLTGKDAAYAYGGEETGIIVKDERLSETDFDDLLICESKSDFDTVIMPVIEEAAKLGKNVYFLHEIETKYKEKVEKLFKNEKNKCVMISHQDIDVSSLALDENEIIPLSVPVIFVAGVIQNTNKFDVQLGLREYLMDNGYKVSQIGSKNYCELFGFHSIPNFFFDNNISEKQKIIWFNRMCKSIELTENPDVFVIGIPGATMVYNELFTNNFGITAFEISNSVRADATIICIPYEKYDSKFLKMVQESSKFKYDMQVDCFNLSNKRFDAARSKGEKKHTFITVDSVLVDNRISELNSESDIFVFNSLNSKNAIEMYGFIVDKLSDHSEL